MASLLDDDVLPLLEGPAMNTIFTLPRCMFIWSAMSAYFLSCRASARFISSTALPELIPSLSVPTPLTPRMAHQSEYSFSVAASMDCLFIGMTLLTLPSAGNWRQNPLLNPIMSKTSRYPVEGTRGP